MFTLLHINRIFGYNEIMITRRNFIKSSVFMSAASTMSFSNTLFANENNTMNSPMQKIDGKWQNITWKKAFDLMEIKATKALENSGVNGIGLFTNANISVEESYALNKLFKAGFRSNNISTNSYNSEEISLKARTLVYGIDGSSGTFDDILNANFVLLYDTSSSNVQINKNMKYININTTNINDTKAYINLNIKDSSYDLLINYIVNEYLLQISEKDIIFLKKHFIFSNLKNKEQWEISLKNYKKSFSKYTLSYISEKVKLNEKENLTDFEIKIKKIKNLFLDDKNKIISLTSKVFNQSKKSLETNILLQTLHLICNKHSRPGCGVFNISNYLSQGSLDDVGLYSNRLPANMYIEYKEHRTKAEKIYNVPKATLNPVSYTHKEFINNINTNTTQFLWLCSDENKDLLKQISNKDLFIVQSTNNFNNINPKADLILPSVSNDKKNSIFISEDRKIRYLKQKNIPKNLSMSLLWQTIEFSKRFKLETIYKKVKVDDKQALKSVLVKFKNMGYRNNNTLFRVLFNNSKLRLFTKDYGLNTEMNSDNRMIIGSDGGIFIGYRYNMQEYLYNEYRQFTLLNAHDLPRYKNIINSTTTIIWPIYDDKSIRYRFNPADDIYAKKALKDNREFSFYGKMGEKNLPFGNLEEITNKKENKKTFKYRAKLFTINQEE